MAIVKPTYLKNAIATKKGYVSPKGELLKAAQLTQAQIDEWNGVVVVEEVKEVVKPKAKKKTTKKKKVTVDDLKEDVKTPIFKTTEVDTLDGLTEEDKEDKTGILAGLFNNK